MRASGHNDYAVMVDAHPRNPVRNGRDEGGLQRGLEYWWRMEWRGMGSNDGAVVNGMERGTDPDPCDLIELRTIVDLSTGGGNRGLDGVLEWKPWMGVEWTIGVWTTVDWNGPAWRMVGNLDGGRS